LIFKEEDNAILNYQDDDGQQIEPEYYIPIIPMILVNGGIGIGTGYSTNIPQFDPSELINICKIICNVIKMSGTVAKTEEDLETINDTINILEIGDITPYYLGFKGTIIKAEKNSYISKGVYRWIDDSTVEITELPIGTWTEDYKESLENMITNGLNNLKYIENHYTSKNVKFILHFNTSVKATMEGNFEALFKLQSSKNLSINNIHLFNKDGAIQKYDTAIEIIKEWSETRILKYFERKNYQIKNLEKEAMVLSNKMRFILDVIAGNIKIMNKKLKEITLRLIELKYPPINTESDKPIVAGAAGAVGEAADADEADADEADDNEADANEAGAGAGTGAVAGAINYKHYNYLLKMPISQLTYDRKVILEREYNELDEKLRNLKNTNIEDLWLNDLNELEKEWEQHRNNILKEYENDRLGIVDAKVVKKKAKK
jgi:DNA topoisomerase-2